MIAALPVGTLRRGGRLESACHLCLGVMIGLQDAEVAPVSAKKSAPKVDVAIAAFKTKTSKGPDRQVFI